MSNPMKRILVCAAWGAAAACMIAAGIGCLINTADAIEEMAVWIGIVVLISGVLQMGGNVLVHDTPLGHPSFTNKAVMVIILGMFIMIKSIIAAEVVRVMVSIVMLFGGLSMLSSAWEVRKDPLPLRQWLWPVGAVEAVLGFCGFLKSVMHGMAFGTAMGISLLVEALIPAFFMAIVILYAMDEKKKREEAKAAKAAPAAGTAKPPVPPMPEVPGLDMNAPVPPRPPVEENK